MTPRTIYEHAILRVEAFPVRTRSGTSEVVRLRAPDWVTVAPITRDGKVVLVRQHRWGIDAETLEVPAGLVEPSESPEVTARRELREETGYGGGTLEPLGWVFSNPAILDNRTWLYALRDVDLVDRPSLDAGEDIGVELHDVARIPDLLADGSIRHSLAVLTLERLLLRR